MTRSLAPVWLLLLVTPLQASAQDGVADLRPRVDSIFARYDRTAVPGCAVGVFRSGSILYARGYGMADLNQGIAISPRTVFYIASTSKQFAAMSIALLAEEGAIRLDDPIRKYVPELPAYTDSITVRHLVHHTSGIRDYLGLWSMSGRSIADEIPEEVALDLIRRQHATNFPVGSRWSYSNSGYFLLSVIVKRASGLSLREYARKRIFEPLGMAATHFHDDNQMIVRRRAEGYQPDGQGGYQIVRTSFALVGDGGLLTTIEDLAAWDANFYTNRLGHGGDRLLREVTTPGHLRDGEALTYAFGLMIGSHKGLPTVRHGGSFIGFRAELVRFPEQRLSVAVLCNDYTANPSALADQVADAYLADHLVDPPSVESRAPAGGTVVVDDATIESLSGRYDAIGFVAEVARLGRTLTLRVAGQEMTLAALSDSVWATDQGLEVRFPTLPSGGRGLVIDQFGVIEPAMKLPPPPTYDARALAGFAGRYVSEELDSWFTVELAEGRLRARARYADWYAMTPVRADEFALSNGTRVAFERDRRGQVTGVRLNIGRALGIKATKTPVSRGG